MKRVFFLLALLLGLVPASAQQAPTYPPPQPPTAVAVSNLPATQPVTGTVAVSNLPANQPVTVPAGVAVTNLPATQPVSGSVAVSNFPSTQAVSSAATVQTCSGTIASATDTIECDVTGTASAVVSVVGTFTGTIQIQGAADLSGSGAALGGRLVFKSGVGSLGTNWIIGTGTAISNEYRIATGGKRLQISAQTGYTGTAAIKVTATQTPSIVFVNGPVHTAEEEAVRTGRGFLASTGSVSVPAGSYLNFVLSNPAGSGKNVFVTLRKFVQSTGNVLTYQGRSNPTPISGGTVVTPSQRRNDLASSSVASFTYQASATNISTGTAGPTGMIPASGIDEAITALRVISPGTSMGYSIGGAGGGLVAQAGIAVDVVWFEESQN